MPKKAPTHANSRARLKSWLCSPVYRENLDFWLRAWGPVKTAYRQMPDLPYMRTIPAQLKERGITRVLDLGCGSGWLSIYLARAGFQVTGLDVAPRAIELARAWAEEESLKIQFDIGDLAELSYPGSSFDAVVANSIFEHLNLELARQTVKRLRELLVAGGSFIGCFDRVGGGPGEYYQLPDGTHVYTDKARKGMLLRFYEDTELSQLFAGWQIDSMQELESGSRLLWARV